MIKWKFVIIRLGILAILLGSVHLGTGPLLRWTLTSSVGWLTGSRLEIESIDASPFQTQMSVGTVRFADPGDPFKNLVDFSGAEIKLDRNALLRKKFIITTGHVDDLQFGTLRDESGKLDPTESSPSPSANLVNDYISGAGKKMAGGITALLTRRFDENFETVRYSKETLDRWPREYDRLIERGKELETRVRGIRDVYRSFSDNPLNTLRDLPRIEQTIRDASKLKNEIESLKQQVRRYRTQIVLDRDNLLAAKNRDLARIKEIKSEKTLNGQTLSQLLVGKTQGKRVDQAIDWIKWMRRTFPHPKDALKARRGRGETIHFPGIVEQPDFLVRRLRLNGHGTVDDSPYVFTGTVTGLTTQPARYGKPAYLSLESKGDVNFQVKGMIDRTTETDRDRLILHIPDLRVAARTIELDDAVRIELARSGMELQARVDLEGKELKGQIKAIQKQVELSIDSDLDSEFAQEFRTLLNEDLGTVQDYEITARLSGTMEDPHWKLSSDLGPRLATAINTSIRRGYDMKKTELIARLDEETEKALDKVAKLLQTNDQVVAGFLNAQTRELFQLEERVSSLLKKTGLRFR